MKYILSAIVGLLVLSGNALANDECIKTADSANSRLIMIYEEAHEYFMFGKYLQAEISLHRAFQKQECKYPAIVNVNKVASELRKQVIILNALTLWEKGDHTKLMGFAESYFDERSGEAWRCRTLLYANELEESAQCFYQLGEFQRYHRDYRASQIALELGRQIN